MTPEELAEHVRDRLGDRAEGVEVEHGQVVATCAVAAVRDVCGELLSGEPRFEYFSFMTAVDRNETFEVVYRLRSFALNAEVTVRTSVPRAKPEMDSVVLLWEGADWHERECAEMFGITFRDHPDPRHILLPDEWQGYPLRKDYVSPHESAPDDEKTARFMLNQRADEVAEKVRAARPPAEEAPDAAEEGKPARKRAKKPQDEESPSE